MPIGTPYGTLGATSGGRSKWEAPDFQLIMPVSPHDSGEAQTPVVWVGAHPSSVRPLPSSSRSLPQISVVALAESGATRIATWISRIRFLISRLPAMNRLQDHVERLQVGVRRGGRV